MPTLDATWLTLLPVSASLHEWWWLNVVEPWVFGDWMWRAMTVSVFVAVACAVLGCWLYVRRLSMMGDALSHVVVPGIAVGFMVTGGRDSGAMLVGAALAGVLAALLIGGLQRRPRIKADAAIGVVYTALFALGVILINRVARNVHLDPDCVLFGNVLGVPDHTVFLMGGICVLVLALTAILYRPLLVSSFDPGFALGIGIPVAALHYGLMTMLSFTAVAAFEAVGAILVVALLIAPAATAHLLTDRMPVMLGLAVVHGLLSSFFGVYIAIWFDTEPSGAMVLVGSALYIAAFLFAPGRGLVARQRRTSARRRSARSATSAGVH